MNLSNQRVLYSDNGVLTDASVNMNNYREGSLSISYTAGQDYIYVASFLPWNHRWLELDANNVNAVAANVSVDIWGGREWRSAIDIIDETSVAGVPLAQSGYLRFSRERSEAWARESDSFDIPGLAGTVIYDMYWIRISWDQDLTLGLTFNSIVNKFSNDDSLYSQYPELNNLQFKSKFEAGKTDWDEQTFIAAERILMDLKARSMLFTADQIMVPEDLREASIHKTAEIIYGAFGEAYRDLRVDAKKAYADAMDFARNSMVDISGDGRLTLGERVFTTGMFRR